VNKKEPVTVGVTGLEPDTTYDFRLQASNANGANPGSEGADHELTTLGPGLHGQYMTQVTSSSATLNAVIDPHGGSTSYYFQYSEEPTEGCELNELSTSACVAVPGAPVGSGDADVHAQQPLQGLTAGREYHYRVVAVSEWAPGKVSEFPGTDHTFVTLPVGAQFSLPDGRAWELVSPADKHGSQLQWPDEEGGVFQSSLQGNAFTYLASGPTEAGPPGASQEVQLLARRGGVGSASPGWSSSDISLPHKEATGTRFGLGEEYRFFSEDFSQAVAHPFGPEFDPLISPQAEEQTAYLRNNANGIYTPLVTRADDTAKPFEPFGEEFAIAIGCSMCGPRFEGATPDAKHIILQTDPEAVSGLKVPLTDAPGDEGGLYEYSGEKPASEQLKLISILPATEAEEQKGEGGKPIPLTSFPDLGADNIDTRGAISTDGSRVVWGESAGNHHLYLRDVLLGETIQLDMPQAACMRAAPPTCGSEEVQPRFQFMSADGSRVFFTDTQQLVEGAGARTNETAAEPDLYECRVVATGGKLSCELSDLTPLLGTKHADVQDSLVGASSDAAYVYFVAGGALAEGAVQGHGDCQDAARACNLYVLHEGRIALVAVLSAQDAPDWGAKRGNGQSEDLTHLVARVSPDGRWLSFFSQRSLTGYDNVDARSGARDEELYLYHAPESLQTGSPSLTCVSCMPSNARPLGLPASALMAAIVGGSQPWSAQAEEETLAAATPGWVKFGQGPAVAYEPRFLSDIGRVFFDSYDALVPQDDNGTWDVYEWEPVGVGGCSTGTSSSAVVYVPGEGGCIGLISSGTSPVESGLLDASGRGPGGQEGEDVFFLTSEKLVSSDVDTALDVYDAHVCSTASPCVTSPGKGSACETADACRAAPSPQPEVFGVPASATFAGPTNPLPPPPAKVKPLTRAQKLAKALSVCRRKHNRHKRVACERQARKTYGAKKTSRAKRAGHGRAK